MPYLFTVLLNKLKSSLKEMPINIILIIIVLALYILNNTYLKHATSGIVQYVLICHFNDLMCPLFLMSYANLLLITVGRKVVSLKSIMFIVIPAGLIWEFFAPFIKPSTTTCLYDLLCYVIGGVLYYYIAKYVRCKKWVWRSLMDLAISYV